MVMKSLRLALEKRVRSSVKNKCDILGPDLEAEIGF